MRFTWVPAGGLPHRSAERLASPCEFPKIPGGYASETFPHFARYAGILPNGRRERSAPCLSVGGDRKVSLQRDRRGQAVRGVFDLRVRPNAGPSSPCYRRFPRIEGNSSIRKRDRQPPRNRSSKGKRARRISKEITGRRTAGRMEVVAVAAPPKQPLTLERTHALAADPIHALESGSLGITRN